MPEVQVDIIVQEPLRDVLVHIVELAEVPVAINQALERHQEVMDTVVRALVQEVVGTVHHHLEVHAATEEVQVAPEAMVEVRVVQEATVEVRAEVLGVPGVDARLEDALLVEEAAVEEETNPKN